MKLKTLYKRDTTGKTQQWIIEVDGPKYLTISGELGGKQTTTKWTTCENKNIGRANETSGEEQALKEAEAKHKKKTEAGYTVDPASVAEAAVFQVMLAKDYDDYKEDLEYPVYEQPKLDGIRCRIDNAGNMWTRNNKPIVSCPHITETLKPYLRKILKDDQYLDGELYNHQLKHNFNRICELVKRTKCSPENLEASRGMVQFWNYDITINDSNFGLRWKYLNTFYETELKQAAKSKVIVLVPTTRCPDSNRLTAKYEEHREAGYEGQIVRRDVGYANKRSDCLLKRKEFQDGEWPIADIVEGEGTRSGTVGHMVFTGGPHGTWKSNVKGTFEFLTKVLRDKASLIGQQATVEYFHLTPDGVPRFPYVTKIRNYE